MTCRLTIDKLKDANRADDLFLWNHFGINDEQMKAIKLKVYRRMMQRVRVINGMKTNFLKTGKEIPDRA